VTTAGCARSREPSSPRSPATENTGSAPDEVRSDLNAYFVAHPEMVLGTHGVASVMYGGSGYTVVPPVGGREAVIKELVERMNGLPPDALAPAVTNVATGTGAARKAASPEGAPLREGAYTVVDEKVFVCKSGELLAVNTPAPMQARLRGLLAVRDACRAALRGNSTAQAGSSSSVRRNI
jgi:N12 class adenine-specific DNA methylase